MGSEPRVCSLCGQDNPARAKFCLECGTRLDDAGAPTAPIDILGELPQQASGGERRLVTVMFADLSGFTSFSEDSDVEDVRAIAHEAAEGLGRIVERYGGTVDKVIGDCVMAVWGAPTSHEDDAERAVRAALDMHAHIEDHAERFAGLKLSIGMNSGEAIWAHVGGQHTVLGDTVNTAARLQGAAAKGSTLIGEATYRATSEAVDYETLEPIAMKNKREPVPAFRPLEVKGAGPRRRTSVPLVGREAERDRLWELWEQVRTERHPYAALVLGSPGIGKSRLTHALTDELTTSAVVLSGRCLPYGEGITYWPIVEMVKQAAGILHDDDHDEVSSKLGVLLESLGSEDTDELRTIAVALANLVGEPRTPRGTYTATEISRGELHWGLRRLLELASRQLPLVLVVEDLHHAEPALLELVGYVLEPRSEAALLGIGTARPEFEETAEQVWGARPNRRTIVLEALGVDASAQLVRRLIGGEGDIPSEVLQRLLDAAGGNPLFLEELIQTWADAGSDLEALAADVPGTLQGLIDSRLDRLPPDERRVLSHAAVIGDVFWSGGLATIEGADGEVDRLLAALEARDLVRSHGGTTLTGEREYSFKSGLIREVAYRRMPRTERADLHERCGRWIATLSEDELAEIVAYHLEEACKLVAELSRSKKDPPILPAVRALTRAGEKSEAREGTREAVGFYERALALLGSRYPETATDLGLRRAYAEMSLGDLERAFVGLSQVAKQATKVGNAELRCRALVTRAETSITLGRPEEARRDLEEAEQVVTQTADRRHPVRLALVRSVLSGSVDGSVEGAERDLREAVELAEEADEEKLLIVARLNLGILAYNTGRLAEAAEGFRRVAELATERGSLRHQATATSLLAAVLYHLGPREEALELATQAVTWFERLGDGHQGGQALRLLGKIALEADDPGTAQERFTQALEVLPPHQLLVAGLQRLLAEARARQGRVIGARAAAAAASQAAGEVPYATAFAAMADGCAGVAERSEDAARRGFERGLELFERQNMTTDLAEARVTYARALTRFGDREGAAYQLELAGKVFEAMEAGASVAAVADLTERTAEGADLFGPLG